MATVKTSTFLGVNLRDALLSALLLAVTAGVGAASGSIYQWFHSSSLAINYEQVILALKAGAWAGIADLGRRILSANKIVLSNVSKETLDAVKDGTAEVSIQSKSNK